MKIAAIYSRKSVYTGKGDSVENQVNMCKDYLQKLNISEFIVYEDEGFSGKNSDRPEFQRMLKDAKAKKFEVLICYRLDRVSRNVADFASLVQKLESYGISFISCSEQFDTTNPMGRAMMYIASVFAQLERETIAERVKDNMIELAKSGRWLGGMTPTGYKSVPVTYSEQDGKEKKMFKLEPIKEELELIKLIYRKYLEYKSISQVEKYLLTNSIKTKENLDWTKSGISSVLKNPVYVKANYDVIRHLESMGMFVIGTPNDEYGILIYNKRKGKCGKYKETSNWICAVSKHNGIIEAHHWLKAQSILKDNHEKAPRLGKSKGGLLAGLMRCAECGNPMRVAYGKVSSETGIKHHYYVCLLKTNSGGTRCTCKNANGNIIDESVLRKLKELCSDEGEIIRELNVYIQEAKANAPTSLDLSRIKAIIKQNSISIDNLVTNIALTSDPIASQALVKRLESLTKENEQLQKQLDNMKSSVRSNEEILEKVNSFIESLHDFSKVIDKCTFEERQRLISDMIDKVYWNGITGEIKINLWGAGK